MQIFLLHVVTRNCLLEKPSDEAWDLNSSRPQVTHDSQPLLLIRYDAELQDY